MIYTNPFYKKNNKVKINDVIKLLKIKNCNYKNLKLNDIKELDLAKKDDITFFNSSKYSDLVNKTKSKFIITNKKYKNLISGEKKLFFVDNVFLAVAMITELFYPNSSEDIYDFNVSEIKKKNKYKNLNFGKNVLIGKNVKLGKNCNIGHNSIIESNVQIGKNCIIGCNVVIKKTIIGDNVNILDGAVIGKKGFGFFPGKNVNIRYPHIGMVLIGNNVEIGCNNTIDRGSLSNTVIGNNTFLDNQVHIAHNVKIGSNCVITGQVGFAGSSSIGNKVMIGGQAGISGHIKIGNNVQIGGGSGVIKNIPNNTKVMGYPAKNIRNFLKENK
tara:strand:+ start:3226 stop:4209 length:984 start_codon:yes stop_codon:yes gene_type:complete